MKTETLDKANLIKMKRRPFKIEMRYNGQVPDKIWFKRFNKAISKGNFEIVVKYN